MPRFKPKGVLERSAAADLWKNTLSQIPTVVGKMAYLAALRDPNTGTYRHDGLTGLFGREQSGKALRESHEQVFLEWLRLTMAQKNVDLARYISDLNAEAETGVSRRTLAENWLTSRIYETHVPASAREMERELYCRDLETLLAMIMNAEAARGPIPSQPASPGR